MLLKRGRGFECRSLFFGVDSPLYASARALDEQSEGTGLLLEDRFIALRLPPVAACEIVLYLLL